MAPEAPIELIDQLSKTLDILRKRIDNYFHSFKDLKNAAFEDYFKKNDISEPELVKGVAQYPDDKGNYFDIPFEHKFPLKTTLYFEGLPFSQMEIIINFPTILFGPRNILPQIIMQISAPIAYPGNFALVWEGLDSEITDYKFHPFEKKIMMKKELKQFYKEGIVDMFCDVLNRGAYRQVDDLHTFLQDFCNGKWRKYLTYTLGKRTTPNIISVPIIGQYHQNLNKHIIRVITWAYGKEYMPPAEVVMHILYPLTAVLSMFDEEGEYIEGSEPLELAKVKQDRRYLSKKEKRKEKKKKEIYDPFKPVENKVERDEFGYVISGKGGFATKDVKTARKSLWEIQKELEEKKGTKNQNTISRDLSHVKSYPNSKAWFDDNANKRFMVKDDLEGLTFVQKGDVNLVKTCGKTFVLKFARDQIRIKRGIISSKAIEILYNVYKLGLLIEV